MILTYSIGEDNRMKVKLKSIRRIAQILVLLLAAVPGISADIEVNASLDTTEYVIGDWIRLNITAEHSGEVIVFPPDPGEKAGDLEVIRLLAFRPEVSGGMVKSRWELTLAAFDTGMFSVPPIEIGYHLAGDSAASTVNTDPLNIYVYSAGGDTLQAPHDIKPQMDAPLEFADFLTYVIALIIAAAGLLLYLWWKKRKIDKSVEPVNAYQPQIDPFELAMKRFVELENQQLAAKGFVKEYWSEVTEIVREYFELAMKIPALEMTTDEFFEAVSANDFLNEGKQRELFMTADLVKFAKSIPDIRECREALKTGEEIVKEARLKLRTTVEPVTVLEQSQPAEAEIENEETAAEK